MVTAVSRAHTASATVHLMGLQQSAPGRGPEKKNGQQAQGCCQFLSRSDREVERGSHCQSKVEYRTDSLVSHSNPTFVAPTQVKECHSRQVGISKCQPGRFCPCWLNIF